MISAAIAKGTRATTLSALPGEFSREFSTVLHEAIQPKPCGYCPAMLIQ
jgi:hypothetical protein